MMKTKPGQTHCKNCDWVADWTLSTFEANSETWGGTRRPTYPAGTKLDDPVEIHIAFNCPYCGEPMTADMVAPAAEVFK